MGPKHNLKLWFTISLMISLQYAGGYAVQDYNQADGFSKPIVSTINGSWEKLNPGKAPSVRIHHDMVYDSLNRKVIVYGGLLDGEMGSDTWEYDYVSNKWTELKPEKSPKPLGYHAMAYDSIENKVIIFGGISTSFVTGETWEYNYETNNWTELKPSYSPTARRYHDMAYDSINKKIILFGGSATSRSGIGLADSKETWAYDYKTNNWTELTPIVSPSARSRHTMEYDPVDQVFVLMGGDDTTGILMDTWVYNYSNNTWTEMNPSNPPVPRYNIDIVYDGSINKTVLYGGYNLSYSFDDTWVYDYPSNTWSEIFTNLSPPSSGIDKGVVYDEMNGKIILFGGVNEGGEKVNDTWSLDLVDDTITSQIATQSIVTTTSHSVSIQTSTTTSQNNDSITEDSTDEGFLSFLSFHSTFSILLFATFLILRKRDN